jgi:hypothetical protein
MLAGGEIYILCVRCVEHTVVLGLGVGVGRMADMGRRFVRWDLRSAFCAYLISDI